MIGSVSHVATGILGGAVGGVVADTRPQLAIATDISYSQDIDDWQSLLDLYLMSNKFRIRVLVASKGNGDLAAFERGIAAYEIDYNRRGLSSQGYASPSYLRSICVLGDQSTQGSSGYTTDTEAAQRLASAVETYGTVDDPVYVCIWGGALDVANMVQYHPGTRTGKCVIHAIGLGQEDPSSYTKNFIMAQKAPGGMVYDIEIRDWSAPAADSGNLEMFRGFYVIPPFTQITGAAGDPAWVPANMPGEGASGDLYWEATCVPGFRTQTQNTSTFKMGDSPTIYYFFKPDGTLRTPLERKDPTIESWGGLFVARPSTNKYWQASIDPADKLGSDNRLRGANTIYKWRTPILANIKSRFSAMGHQPFPTALGLSSSNVTAGAVVNATPTWLNTPTSVEYQWFDIDDNSSVFGPSSSPALNTTGLVGGYYYRTRGTNADGVGSWSALKSTTLNMVAASGYEAETTAYIAARGSAPSTPLADAINTFIVSLKSASVTAANLDGMYIHTDNLPDFELNLFGPSVRRLTKHGSFTFTAYVGAKSDGTTGYYDSGFNPTSTVGRHMALNDSHMGVYSEGDVAISNGAAGNTNFLIAPREVTSDRTSGRTHTTSGTQTYIPSDSDFSRLYGISRGPTSSPMLYRLRDGVIIVGPTSPPSGTVSNSNLMLHTSDGGTSINTQTLGLWYFGAYLTEAQHLAIFNAYSTFRTSMGAPL